MSVYILKMLYNLYYHGQFEACLHLLKKKGIDLLSYVQTDDHYILVGENNHWYKQV